MTRLVFGRTRAELRRVLVWLLLANLIGLGALVALYRWAGPALGPSAAVLAVLAVTVWLASFVLGVINAAAYLLAPRSDEDDDR